MLATFDQLHRLEQGERVTETAEQWLKELRAGRNGMGEQSAHEREAGGDGQGKMGRERQEEMGQVKGGCIR